MVELWLLSRGKVEDKARTKDIEKEGKILEEFTAGNLKLLKIARSLMRLKAIKIGLEAWGIVTRNFYEELPRKRTVMQNAFHK